MKREYPDAPLVGVGAIIIDQERVLLVRRGKEPLAGSWSIPGGLLDIGETLSQAVVREAFEETGLTVEAGELLGVYDRIMPDADQRTRYHYVLVDFLCRRISGELQAAGDAADARWFTSSELGQISLAEDTAEVIRMGFLRAKTERPAL
jgi:8-oxo-dGTP diphosphatase